MSTTTLSNYKKPPRRRGVSDELDVFEASRYFSGYNDNSFLVATNEERVTKEGKKGYFRQGRASLDMPSLKHHHQKQEHYYKQYHENYTISQLEQYHQQQQQQQIKEKKKYKQPSSPSGKIAHFLSTLFNQTIITSKKKKQPKTTHSLSLKGEDESPSGKRHRRNSISHYFRSSSSSVVDAKTMYSSSCSGFTTPPPYTLKTPTKHCQNNVNTFHDDYKQVLATFSKYKIHENEHASAKDVEIIRATKMDCVDEKIKNNNVSIEKPKNYNHVNTNNIIRNHQETNKYDEGEESDASSDLFELQIDDYEFEFCSSGLPVYETTHLDNIKRPSSTAISNGPIEIN